MSSRHVDLTGRSRIPHESTMEGPGTAVVPLRPVLTEGQPGGHLGDFTRWKEHDAYRKALERLLRDLKVGASPATAA